MKRLLQFAFAALALAAVGRASPPALPPGQAAAAPRVMPLSLKQAVQIALEPEGSARIQLAEEAIGQARARSAQARAALLPDLSFQMTGQNQTRNLEALGIRFDIPIPGFRFPTLVGPFTTLDARGSVTQTLFDFSSIRRFQAARIAVSAARAESDYARDQVAEQVARAYMAALRAGAARDAARAAVQLSEALLKVAQDQKAAGTGTGIDVTRAGVQLANDRQRALAAENERTRALLQLLRALGLELDVQVELTDTLAYQPVALPPVEEEIRAALESRRDLKAQERRERNANVNHSAVKMERLPSVAAFGDYGSIGTGIDRAIPTRTYGVAVRIPVFDGGRRDARRAESAALLRQEAVRTRDLRAQVEMEVRVARDNLRTAEEQVRAAEDGLQLAEHELAQARRRYEAGVTTSVEVVDAQTRLARARDNRVAALFSFNSARVDIAAATGSIRSLVQ